MNQLPVLQHPVSEFVFLEGNQVVHDSRKKLFAGAWRDVKSAFAVNSYCNILQKDFNEAISYINAWRTRLVCLSIFNIIWLF
ncbi:ORF6C domain-containing protein [Bacillus toyonensis]|uniref:ORF6C domain-containing protein n=1 Tax=Bacillus toyonensis TaxID=155322 RepID=UPI0011560A2D|nr:ORF6C domain-containing protein [Bacillus toyonensis]